VQVQAVAATERPLKKVEEQTFDLPKGSKIKVWLLAVHRSCAAAATRPFIARFCF
jgi:hypothetical protein